MGREGEGCERLTRAVLFWCRLGGFERRPLVLQRVMRHKSVLSAEEDEFVQRHLRIQTLLAKNGLRERVIRGDGNCQFSALSDQLYHTPAYHKHVRKYVIYHLVRNPDAYMHFVCGESWTAYLKRMAKPGEWGDHLTLQAAANVYGIQINLLTSYAEQAYIEVQPKVRCSERILWLTFMAEVHYNSIKTVGEPDRPEFDERVRCSIS